MFGRGRTIFVLRPSKLDWSESILTKFVMDRSKDEEQMSRNLGSKDAEQKNQSEIEDR